MHPLLLTGSDCCHLVTPIGPVCLGPLGGPVEVKTRLGWTLQGPVRSSQQHNLPQQCLFLGTISPTAELFNQMEKLWQLDVLSCRSEKLEPSTGKDNKSKVRRRLRYTTLPLHVNNRSTLTAQLEAVLPSQHGTEKRLSRDPVKAEANQTEIRKLEKAGYATEINPAQSKAFREAWFIPHHLVTHNHKNRTVINCPFTYREKNLNELLLAGPNLGTSLPGVLLRFREHSIAISIPKETASPKKCSAWQPGKLSLH